MSHTPYLVLAVATSLWTLTAHADEVTTTRGDERPAADAARAERAETAKKDQWLDAKQHAPAVSDAARRRWHQELDKRIGQDPTPVVNIFNTWTHEFAVIEAGAEPELPPQVYVDQFLRCHFTNEPTDMDPRLFGVLAQAAAHFGSDRIDIVSGYRAPKYNLILRKKGRGVAKESKHTMGLAVDFRVRGVPIARLHGFARGLRLGGVGYYPASKFIHVDTARIRYWTGR